MFMFNQLNKGFKSTPRLKAVTRNYSAYKGYH